MNKLWIDIESTGLSPQKNDIWQLACIPIVDGVKQPAFNEKCQPLNWNAVQPEALAICNITVAELKIFQTQEELLNKFVDYLKTFKVKFAIAGYNVSFDKNFLSAMFSKHDRNLDFFRLFSLDVHDTYVRAKKVKSKFNTENLKLGTLAKAHNIPISAHDALSDITATMELDKIISGYLGEDSTEYKPTASANQIVVNTQFKEMAHLHVHSKYSMGDSIPDIDNWVEYCLKTGSPGFAALDHGTAISTYFVDKIPSMVQEYNKTNKTEFNDSAVHMVPGTNLYLEAENREICDISCWAISTEGYYNLMALSSIGFESPREINGKNIPIVTFDQIEKYKAGLRFGSAGVNGYIGKAVQSGDEKEAKSRFLRLKNLGFYFEFNPIDITRRFEDNIGFTTIKPNSMVKEGNLQKSYNKYLAELINLHGGRCIPVTEAHFIDIEDKTVQDCLCKNSNKNSAYFHESYHQKDTKQIFKELKIHLGDWLTEDRFAEWIDNTHEIVRLAQDIKIECEYHLPKIQIPNSIQQLTDNYDKQTYLYMMQKVKEHGRWNDDPEYIKRFESEVDVIMNNETLNFIPYFLIYEDLGSYARSMGFLQNIARGSAGGCLLSYYLKIIHVDPIEKNLPFERFLSPARIRAGSFPDIDMDLGDTARPYIMKYLSEKYDSGFAQISTFSKMKTKNAIKDAMWALYGRNRNDFEIKGVCDTISDSPQGVDERDFLYGYTDKEGDYHRGELEINAHLANFFNSYKDVERMVDKLIGVVRGWSRHASAFVISTVDLASERTPTMIMQDKDIGSIRVTQYDASMVEGRNLVKADILGIKTLTMVSDCVKLIKERTGVDYLDVLDNGLNKIYSLPEDENVYADFYNKKTDSSFQFNSNTVKSSVQRFIPTERCHLSAMTALLRPGAMDAEFEPGVSAADYYMDVRSGKRKIEFIHSDLEDLLKDSNGIFVYQEEVMKFLVDFAGYTPEESDTIRSAIAKKKHGVMMSAFDKIRSGAKQRNWSEEVAEKLCHTIMAFSRYSFNKSHAYAYAELGYITMYLKHHHPLEWWASVLNSADKEDKMRNYISLLGDKVSSPDMKFPSSKFEIRGDKIVAPLSVIKRIGVNTTEELMRKGPFEDLEDFTNRIEHRRVNAGHVAALIKARAADSLMDLSLPYAEARMNFVERYMKLRKKSTISGDLYNTDPLSIFLMERDSNEAFNKCLLSDPDIKQMITSKWSGLQSTGNVGIPFMMGTTPVLSNVRIGEGLLDKGFDKNIAMILLFNGSNMKRGISKKTGRPYSLLSILLSDGYHDVECVDWNAKTALKYPINSVVYVRGALKEGYNTKLSISIKEIELIK